MNHRFKKKQARPRNGNTENGRKRQAAPGSTIAQRAEMRANRSRLEIEWANSDQCLDFLGYMVGLHGKRLPDMTWKESQNVSMPFGKHRDTLLGNIDDGYLIWSLENITGHAELLHAITWEMVHRVGYRRGRSVVDLLLASV